MTTAEARCIHGIPTTQRCPSCAAWPGVATLTYTQGLPGAGKTTWARAHADQHDAVYVSTDAIRTSLYGRRWTGTHADADPAVRQARDTAVVDGLRAGRAVIVDGTHLTPAKVAHLEWIADILGTRIRCVDFTGVPVETCIERALQDRDGADDGVVAYIRELHAQYLALAGITL